MAKADMLALGYTGFHNLYPVYVHKSEEYGAFCIARAFPRLYSIWSWFTCKLFANGEGLVFVTGSVDYPLYMPSYYMYDLEEETE